MQPATPALHSNTIPISDNVVCQTTKFERSAWRALVFACVVLGLAIACLNPNYQWSAARTEPFGADFLQEWTAGDMLLRGAGEKIYDSAAFDAWQHDASRLGFTWSASEFYPAVYPPAYYVMVAPLARLPYSTAVYVWLTLMLTAYAWAARVLQHGAINSSAQATRATLFWTVCLIFPATFFGLVLGQKGTLWLAILATSFMLHRSQRPLASGLVAALLTLKPTLVLVIPIAMLINRQWRFLIGFTGGAVGLFLLSLFFVPLSLWLDYAQVVMGSASYQAHGGYHSGWSTSVLSLLKSLGLHGAWCWIGYAICLVAIMSRLRLRCSPGQLVETTSAPQFWLLMLAATALLSPHAYFYDLVWLLAPISGQVMVNWRRGALLCSVIWLSALWAQSFPDGLPVAACALLLVCFSTPAQSK